MQPRDEMPRDILQLASIAAHDVAGPIDQISSLAALLERRYRGKVDSEGDAMLTHIAAARARLGRTALGLRKCLQASTAEYRPVQVDMNAVLRAAATSLHQQLADNSAELSMEPLPTLMGDRDLLVLLVESLLDNALKFSQPGQPPRIVVTAESAPESHILQVRDHGIGIEARHLEDVFEPFRRLNGPAYPGAGFGLTVARMIVQLHGGKIWIEPADPGTSLRFELPAGAHNISISC